MVCKVVLNLLTCRFWMGFGSSIIGTNCIGINVVISVVIVVVVVSSVVVVEQGVVVTNANGSSSTKLFSSPAKDCKAPLVLGLHKPGSLVIQQYLYHFTAVYTYFPINFGIF